MDKLTAAIQKVQKYEAKLSEKVNALSSLGVDPTTFWATFPAGSKERSLASEITFIQRDLDRAREALAKREAIEAKQADKPKQEEKQDRPEMWMQSKTGMWHRYGFELQGEKYPNCQSYNLDRPNTLSGEALKSPPDDATICKKCQSKNSGKLWKNMG